MNKQTGTDKKIAALIVAGGSGARFGSDMPKQYLPLLGKSVLQWSTDAFSGLADEIVAVVNPDYPRPQGARCGGAGENIKYVAGGATRQQSVRNGLAALRATKPDIVLIHDAARPLLTQDLIKTLVAAAAQSGAATPALPVTDTVKRNGKTESRENLFTVQTPQAFDFTLIDGLHEKYKDRSFTDDAALCEADGQEVALVAGQPDNIKITHPQDLARAESLLSARNGDVRTGQGYDVHRLVPAQGKKLMLCGVAIPHDFTLEGHSDADAGLHALTDALLAAIGAGDIGQHFSPSDPRWKDADSTVFLKHAAELVTTQGGLIAHVDVTIVCEAPKIAPHRAVLQRRVANILNLPPSRVSIKATTTEGLGFTGRREGIAAQAIATVRLPFVFSTAQNNEELKWAS
ncbi:MAG: bifunctional 2-C-methyl-D-erythritol 4-phosphate cytidylyltransferase/2-C-methyl-D-erythritol 2,4-cyclodiphosphate synthase [Alphaproteobacteria bacterium]|nr:bifunctional 2-C-methyl-D-erythritol 4-phosphate cytidylyltransferase/2-C-methyl-D-erythritol 2,4-cyclodiphosphate synthase [Alphaproteobacteria bacterium]MDE2336868.1 bifunctional 2-C-methyl-D-erythritol 4-phosphate cytidylyltransferase/2-C-methyl-D-erythritol 2,4-cyclodiphosphate synthase [Alphaproteobacteria bacterium]